MNEAQEKIKLFFKVTIEGYVGYCPDELAEQLTSFLIEYAYKFAEALLKEAQNE